MKLFQGFKLDKLFKIINVGLNKYLLFLSIGRRSVDVTDIFHSVKFFKSNILISITFQPLDKTTTNKKT